MGDGDDDLLAELRKEQDLKDLGVFMVGTDGDPVMNIWRDQLKDTFREAVAAGLVAAKNGDLEDLYADNPNFGAF